MTDTPREIPPELPFQQAAGPYVREIKRHDALMQVCEWAPRLPDFAELSSAWLVTLLCAIQADAYGPDTDMTDAVNTWQDARRSVIETSLRNLCLVWDQLPAGERDTVLAGVLPDVALGDPETVDPAQPRIDGAAVTAWTALLHWHDAGQQEDMAPVEYAAQWRDHCGAQCLRLLTLLADSVEAELDGVTR